MCRQWIVAAVVDFGHCQVTAQNLLVYEAVNKIFEFIDIIFINIVKLYKFCHVTEVVLLTGSVLKKDKASHIV